MDEQETTQRRKPPGTREVCREVAVWNPNAKEWLRGRDTGYLVPRDLERFDWTNTGENTDVAPDHDKEIDVTYAQRIAIQIDTTNASNTSSDIDVNVEADLGDGVYDTEPYAQANLGDAEVKTFLVEPWAKKIRLRCDNNEAATTGYVRARVLVWE